MAHDVVEKMNNQAGDALDPAERYFGAQNLTIKGRIALAEWAEDTDVADSLPNYIATHGEVEQLEVSDDTIPNAFVAAVTERRLMVFSRSLLGRPKELVESFDLEGATLDVVDVGDRARSRIFVFGTPDGNVFAGECAINGKALDHAEAFVSAWGEASSLSSN